MARAHVRTRRPQPLRRAFERSRLEEQLAATAYELACPRCRQPLSTPQHRRQEDARQQPPATKGGLSA
jgi:hypothetical protein